MKDTVMNYMLFLALIIIPAACFSLQSDHKKAAHVKANFVQQDPKHRRAILIGHVRVDQGTTHIRAAKAIIYRDTHGKTKKVRLWGNPAFYHTLSDSNQTPLTATAKQITYLPQQHHIILLGDAHIDQAGNIINGPKIVYNTLTKTLLSATQGSRTTIIYQPQAAS